MTTCISTTPKKSPSKKTKANGYRYHSNCLPNAQLTITGMIGYVCYCNKKNIEQLSLSGILMKYDIGSRRKVKVNELSDTNFLTLGCLQKSGLLKYTTQQTPTPKIGLVSYFMIKNLQNMCFWSKFCFSHKNNQHIYNYQACGVLFLVLHVCVENCLRSRVNESSGLDSVHSTNTLPWRVHQSSQFLRIFDIREI